MAQYIYLVIPVIGAICWLIGYRVHVNFGRDVLRETKSAESLKHAAEFSRSYRSANFKSIADAIAKLFGKGRPPLELGQRRHLARPGSVAAPVGAGLGTGSAASSSQVGEQARTARLVAIVGAKARSDLAADVVR